jgi:hypothetical protein
MIWASSKQMSESMELLRSVVPGAELIGEEPGLVKDEPCVVDPVVLCKQLQTLKAWSSPFALENLPNLPLDEWHRYYSHIGYRRRSNRACRIIESYAFVGPGGELFPCFSLSMGNVFQQRFTRVWNNRRFRSFRRLIRQHQRLPFCERCPD